MELMLFDICLFFFLQKELQACRQDVVCTWVLHNNNLHRQNVLEELKLI